MGIGWISVLQAVPWTDVIRNAPKVAEGARKLWSTVNRKTASPAPPSAGRPAAFTTGAGDVAGLQAQLSAMEAAVSELHAQMQASSDLIKTLADQNTQLVRRLEVQRVWGLWLAAATVVSTIAAVAALAYALRQYGA